MNARWLMFAWAAAAFAQAPDGDYHFVDLRLKQGGAATAISGSMRIQGSAAAVSARRAIGGESGQTVVGSASLAAFDSFASRLSGLADSNLRLRTGQNGVLLGTGIGGDHELLLALRKSSAAPVIRGTYSGVLLRFPNGVASNAITAQVVWTAQPGGTSAMAIVSHDAAGDGLNRNALQVATTPVLSADGGGTLVFGADGPLRGSMTVAASADGGILMGTTLDGATRDLLILARDIVGSATEDVLSGTYWVAELGGESPFVEQAGSLRVSSADGSLFSFGNGVAAIAESVQTGSQVVELSTATRYRLASQDRNFGPVLMNGLRNFAVAEDLALFIATWTGRPNELTLEHGVMLGVRAPALRLAALNAGSSAPVTAALAPGQLVSLYGSNFASAITAAQAYPLPTDLGGVRITVNGTPAGILMSSPGQVNFQLPFDAAPGVATIEVRAASGTFTLQAAVAVSSPGVFSLNQTGTGAAIVTHANFQLVTAQNPARPNETVLVFLTGLGAVTPALASGAAATASPLNRVSDPTLQVLFNGIAGRLDFAGLTPGFAGLYQLNVVVPDDERVNGSMALGIRTGSAYSDLTDVPVSR